MFFHIIFLPSSLLLLFSFADTVYFTLGLLRGFFFFLCFSLCFSNYLIFNATSLFFSTVWLVFFSLSFFCYSCAIQLVYNLCIPLLCGLPLWLVSLIAFYSTPVRFCEYLIIVLVVLLVYLFYCELCCYFHKVWGYSLFSL